MDNRMKIVTIKMPPKQKQKFVEHADKIDRVSPMKYSFSRFLRDAGEEKIVSDNKGENHEKPRRNARDSVATKSRG